MTYLLGEPVIYPRDLCEYFVRHWVLELLVQGIDDHVQDVFVREVLELPLWDREACVGDSFWVFHLCAPQMLTVFEPERVEEADASRSYTDLSPAVLDDSHDAADDSAVGQHVKTIRRYVVEVEK
jgi:hypothetical protein